MSEKVSVIGLLIDVLLGERGLVFCIVIVNGWYLFVCFFEICRISLGICCEEIKGGGGGDVSR